MPVLKEWYQDEEKYNTWATGPAHPASYRTVVADSLFNGTATPSYNLRISNISEIQTLCEGGPRTHLEQLAVRHGRGPAQGHLRLRATRRQRLQPGKLPQ